MGAIASGGVRVLNPDVVAALRISSATIDCRGGRRRNRRNWNANSAPIAATFPFPI